MPTRRRRYARRTDTAELENMPKLPAFATLALVGLALAGCSAGTSTAGSSAGSGGASASSAPSAPSAPSGGTATGAVDVCSAVPVATIVSLTGRSGYLKTNGGSSTQSGADVDVCQYFDTDDASTGYQLTLAVFRNGDPAKIFADRAALMASLAPVSGYGDRAQAGDGELEVVYGSRVITATDALHPGDESSLSTAQLAKIVEAMHAKL